MKRQLILSLLISAGIFAGCESKEVDPALKANAGFTFVNHERIPALPMSGRLNVSLHRPPIIFFVSHEDSASLYINISYSDVPNDWNSQLAITVRYMLPLEFFDLKNENLFFGLKSLELLQDKKFIQWHSVSYFSNSEDKNIMLLSDQNIGGSIALDITNVQIVTDEFENSWFYMEGHFEGEMINSKMWYYPVYEYHYAKEDEKKLKIRSGSFSSLYLLDGSTIINAK